jgi:SET domain-containing protein
LNDLSKEDPESPVDSFNANFVPIRSDRLGQYRTATLPMAYRLMGSKQIEKSDLMVARSEIAGYGLFAGRKYVANELIIEYQGEVIGQALADWREFRLPAYKKSCYMFRLDDAHIIDATVVGNAARFINHCCQPNCKTKPVVIEGQPRILIIAKKEIGPGEELSYDYQFALDEDDGKGRLPCYCGARKCRGWMN